jgi:hypothetical protein
MHVCYRVRTAVCTTITVYIVCVLLHCFYARVPSAASLCVASMCVCVNLSFSAVYCCCCVCLMLDRDTTYGILQKGGYVTSNAHYAVRPVALHMCCIGLTRRCRYITAAANTRALHARLCLSMRQYLSCCCYRLTACTNSVETDCFNAFRYAKQAEHTLSCSLRVIAVAHMPRCSSSVSTSRRAARP